MLHGVCKRDVFAQGNIFHFGRDYAAARVIHLRLSRGEFADFATGEGHFFGSLLHALYGRVAALQNPVGTRSGKPFRGVEAERFVAPRAACIVYAHGFVGRARSVGVVMRRRQFNFRKAHFHVAAPNVYFPAAGVVQKKFFNIHNLKIIKNY